MTSASKRAPEPAPATGAATKAQSPYAGKEFLASLGDGRFKAPDLRKYLDLYLRGSGGVHAVGRVKLMNLLWGAVGSAAKIQV